MPAREQQLLGAERKLRWSARHARGELQSEFRWRNVDARVAVGGRRVAEGNHVLLALTLACNIQHDSTEAVEGERADLHAADVCKNVAVCIHVCRAPVPSPEECRTMRCTRKNVCFFIGKKCAVRGRKRILLLENLPRVRSGLETAFSSFSVLLDALEISGELLLVGFNKVRDGSGHVLAIGGSGNGSLEKIVGGD